MFGSEFLDVGIGMILLFLFMSLIATALREAIENVMKSRARLLEQGITELLAEDGGARDLVSEFYKHPLISSLYHGPYVSGGRHLPSYIPRQSFSLALLDLLAEASKTGIPLALDGLEAKLKVPNQNGAQRVVLAAIGTAEGDLARVRTAVEDWYDGTMDRVAGWYARRTGRILAIIGLGAAVLFNVDAITVAEHLIRDKSLRAAVVRQAPSVLEATSSAAGPSDGSDPARAGQAPAAGNLPALIREFEGIGFPTGWRAQDGWIYPAPQTCRFPQGASTGAEVVCSGRGGWFVALLGWLITSLAIMLGAPFWFDLLNKFMVVRSTVKPKEKSPDEASADA